jgi:hypothetical protein
VRSDEINCGACGNVCMRTGTFAYPQSQHCENGECVCDVPRAEFDPVCGCMTPAYYCCAPGDHCPLTHECVVVGTNPDGSPYYGCV